MKKFTAVSFCTLTILFGLLGCAGSANHSSTDVMYYSSETDSRLIFEKLVLSLDKHQYSIEFFPSNPLVRTEVVGKPELKAPNTVGALKNTIVNSVNDALIAQGVKHLAPITRDNIEVFGGRHVNTQSAYRNEMPLLAKPNGQPYRVKISFVDPNKQFVIKKIAEGNFTIYSDDSYATEMSTDNTSGNTVTETYETTDETTSGYEEVEKYKAVDVETFDKKVTETHKAVDHGTSNKTVAESAETPVEETPKNTEVETYDAVEEETSDNMDANYYQTHEEDDYENPDMDSNASEAGDIAWQ